MNIIRKGKKVDLLPDYTLNIDGNEKILIYDPVENAYFKADFSAASKNPRNSSTENLIFNSIELTKSVAFLGSRQTARFYFNSGQIDSLDVQYYNLTISNYQPTTPYNISTSGDNNITLDSFLQANGVNDIFEIKITANISSGFLDNAPVIVYLQ